MSNLTRPIKNILLLGATGNIGIPLITALTAHPAGYTLTALTRSAAAAAERLPRGVKILETDFTDASLHAAFTGQDAVVSVVPAIADQQRFIDIAVASGVARFIPSEFGMATLHGAARSVRPELGAKIDVQDYLRARQDRIAWTVFITGAFFDWGLALPGGGFGIDVTKRRAEIYDGGNEEWEATTVSRIAEAVANSLAPENQERTKNQAVYVNSFTLSQKRLLEAAERVAGGKFEVQSGSLVGLKERGEERLSKGDHWGMLDVISANLLGLGGINRYSKEKELWNEKLQLKEEDLDEIIRGVVKSAV